MPFRLPVNHVKFLKSDYEEPTDMEKHKKELLDSGKATFHEILREVDAQYGMCDGFNYGSNGRYATTTMKHVRKPVGPMELFRVPATESMNYGFWMADPVLKCDPWYKCRETFHRANCEIVKYVERGLQIDKMFRQ
ncbi:hypothetical protein WA026_018459 [Henosepilachna vigintioctopunctata]|uniref:Uncharacterized protein n=1 Tax=Henosepilachna vigintioctopunctata TaxID=420089 RepID=A0AAW1V172_9CUCU